LLKEGSMKRIAISIVACFLVALCAGCERTEKAVDLYKNAKKQAEEAHEKAKRIVDEKTKDALDIKSNSDDTHNGKERPEK
jgi:hypothetical protein